MKQLFTSYTSYNLWANQLLVNIILGLSEEDQHKEITSSFSSIHKTLEHLWNVESIWYQRFQKVEQPVPPSTLSTVNTQQVIDGLLFEGNRWNDYIASLQEERLNETLHYKNLKGQPFATPVWQLLQHIFNHGTYHRGQLVTMLRQLGVSDLPSTDYVTYARLV